MPSMSRTRRLGDEAEERAVDFLQSLGYTIVTRNAHSRRGEIDIVALDGDLLVFVEVKMRQASLPEEAIGPIKAARLRDAARDYLISVAETERSYRFDLIAVDSEEIRHHPGVLRD